jgi:hypothetical protein
MSSFRIAWILGARRDRRTRAVLIVALAALVFGLALQSARACASAVNAGGGIAQASASRASDFDARHCHHDAGASLDACFVHCEQDGQAARASADAGADDLRLAAVDSTSAYGARQATRPAPEPAPDARRLDLPAYLLLHRLNR